jgi:hypothetical protein
VHLSGLRDNTVRMPFSVRQVIEFLSQTQLWEDSSNRPDDVCSRLDAILDKASLPEEFQPFGRQTPWSDAQTLLWNLRAAEVQPSGR